MFGVGSVLQISKMIQNVRPDRQTVLFSATLPRGVSGSAQPAPVLAGRAVTIQVSAIQCSVQCCTVQHHSWNHWGRVGRKGKVLVSSHCVHLSMCRVCLVSWYSCLCSLCGRAGVGGEARTSPRWWRIRPDNQQRFLRLLELLGEWGERAKCWCSCSHRTSATLFRDLLKAGTLCLSSTGLREQTDRESTITDFKMGVSNLLIATSVAARGLDVKELELVVNYDAPRTTTRTTIHRVGRAKQGGRAQL